jgi:hypothetical protein
MMAKSDGYYCGHQQHAGIKSVCQGEVYRRTPWPSAHLHQTNDS